MARYFSLVYPGRTLNQLRNDIAANLIDRDPLARDNSFVKYDLLPDRNAAFRRRDDNPMRQVQYGRLLDIYYVEYTKQDEQNARVPYLLARIAECETGGLDAAQRGTPLVKYNRVLTPVIVHLETINAVIGRVSLGSNAWAIVDRSRDGARTQFLDDDGNIDPNLE
ncbi:hypothetical protein RHS01_10413 [Rhizoctonia solani]|uniref:Uncharacterized protein n=1 Tax=Rhizoctonia solani TaxID=456999 RepID=A0A8H7I3E9_9AGAM|nr:hypothetical protein RHS01_10413 [Rhizoctonia solani]